jgi:hypothetical protein
MHSDWGSTTHFWDFLGYPLIYGRRTWFVLALHGLAGGTGFLILARALLRQPQARNGWRDWLIGRSSPTAFMLSAAFLGYGLVLTLPGLRIYRYYLIAAFPLVSVWVAHLALANPSNTPQSLRTDRTLLFNLCVTQLLLTANLLGYLHVNQGATLGDYGVAYRHQAVGAAAPSNNRGHMMPKAAPVLTASCSPLPTPAFTASLFRAWRRDGVSGSVEKVWMFGFRRWPSPRAGE